MLKAEERFRFEAEQVTAFQTLKKTLINRPVIRLYRIGADTELHTDASSYGFGSILLQRDSNDGVLHPIHYASGKTNPAEAKYASYELKVLAVIISLRKFRVYLLGVPFKIVTDCRAFALTMNKKDLLEVSLSLRLLLEEFEYVIEHRPGKNMLYVDALSCYPLPESMLICESDNITARLKNAQKEDGDILKLLQAIESKPVSGYRLRSDTLFKDVEDDLKCKPNHKRAHEVGHFAAGKTESMIKRDYWFSNMKAEGRKGRAKLC